MAAAGILLADHVLMALENEGRNMFLAGRGFFRDDDIAGRIGLAGKSVAGCELLEVFGHFLFMAGFARNLRDLAENAEYRIGIHIGWVMF